MKNNSQSKEHPRDAQRNMVKEKTGFLRNELNRNLVLTVALLTAIYFYLITFTFTVSNEIIFGFLIAGEVFHVFQVFMYLYTTVDMDYEAPKDDHYLAPVDVFVTVAGEPKDIVAETLTAIKNMDYPYFEIYILNDGKVAKKDNWAEMEDLAREMHVNCVTRDIPGGAKAGNINNGLRNSTSPFVAIFDADHVPHTDFLKKMMPYFVDEKVAFVQSPQFYKNYSLNYITLSAWEQQQLFFGPICKGKNRLNAATMCGTNMCIRRTALELVGGMAEKSIAEDFLTGIRMHMEGLKSVYVAEVLAEGLAPEDFLSYFKQQFRWARGAFDILFPLNTILQPGLTWQQRLQYFSSVSFYFSGLFVLMNAVIPVVFFFTGLVPFYTSTMVLATVFLPYIFLTLYVLQKSSNFTFTFRALVFSMGGFSIHIGALWAVITRQKSIFSVTAKRQLSGNFVKLVIPHIIYILAVIIGMTYAFMRDGLSAAFIANSAWALLNVGVFIPFIYAALPEKGLFTTLSLTAEPELTTPSL